MLPETGVCHGICIVLELKTRREFRVMVNDEETESTPHATGLILASGVPWQVLKTVNVACISQTPSRPQSQRRISLINGHDNRSALSPDQALEIRRYVILGLCPFRVFEQLEETG